MAEAILEFPVVFEADDAVAVTPEQQLVHHRRMLQFETRSMRVYQRKYGRTRDVRAKHRAAQFERLVDLRIANLEKLAYDLKAFDEGGAA